MHEFVKCTIRTFEEIPGVTGAALVELEDETGAIHLFLRDYVSTLQELQDCLGDVIKLEGVVEDLGAVIGREIYAAIDEEDGVLLSLGRIMV
jgi:hypothetical protein